MPDERRQFCILYRDSLLRIVDLEALSAGGDTGKLLGQLAALLAALGFTFLMVAGQKYMTGTLVRDQMLAAIHAETRFLFATGMAVAGLAAVMAWNTILPDRRDCAILGVLPVQLRTLFLARTAAVASVIGGALVALNLFPGIFYPILSSPDGAGVGSVLAGLIAYWVAVAAMGGLLICALLAVQGISAMLLSRRAFLRFSSWIQLGAFFGIVGSYFLMPPAPSGMSTASMGTWSCFPSSWFFALWTAMSGTASPCLSKLAERSIWALAAVSAVGLSAALAAFPRVFRRTIEQPDITPAERSWPASRLLPLLAGWLFPRPLERAIVLFTARTLLRSRQHRLLLAMWSGIGLAISLVYVKDLVYGYSGGLMDSLAVNAQASSHWNQANIPFLVATLVLLFFAIVGARTVFVLPIELRGNWVFRITAVHSPAAYFSVVRKALLALGAVPVWIASLVLLAIWPPIQALEHVAVLILTGVLLVEVSLYRFRKIPFTCSYLPGRSSLNVRLGVYAALLLFAADRGAAVEYWALQNGFAFLAPLAALLWAAVWAHRRTAEFANARENRIQFEEAADAEIFALDLRQDGAWLSDDAYVNSIDVKPARWNVDRREPSAPRLTGLSLFETAAPTTKEPPLPVRIQLEQLWQDLRHGVRVFRKSPRFSAAIVVLIAVGLGVNLTIFSVIQTILSKPAPAVRAAGLVIFGHTINGEIAVGGPLNSYPDYLDLAAQSKTMSSLAASGAAPWLTLTLPDGTYEVRGEMVTPNYFETLGVDLVEGRPFTSEEAEGAGEFPVVIGYKLWQEQFHGASGVIGREVILNGRPATVVGIAGDGFQGDGLLPRFEIGLPLPRFANRDRIRDRGWRSVAIIGRLAHGATLSAARKEFQGLSERLRSLHPEEDAGWAVALQPYSATAFGPNSSPQARRLMMGVTLIGILALLVVCANVASLMFGRSVKRAREIAVRLSLGASRLRLVRMLLAEGLSLCMAACLAAWFLTVWVTRAMGRLAPPLASGARFPLDLSPDGATLVYGMILAALAAVLFTLAPVSGLWRERVLPLIRAAEGSIIQSRSRLLTGMVVAQIALCAVLVAAGSLAYRSLFHIDNTDIYFTKSHLLLAQANTAGAATSTQENLLLLERLRTRMEKIEGVTCVSYATAAPPHDHGWMDLPVHAVGSDRSVLSDGTEVGPEYIAALGVPQLSGRDISADDINGGRPTAVINRKLAGALWPGETAVGKSMLLGEGQPIEVVGVVPNGDFSGVGKDGSFRGIGADSRPNFIFLSKQREASAPGAETFHIRYRGDLEPLIPRIRSTAREIDGRIPIFSVRTMDEEFSSFTAPIRIITLLIAAFGISALVLSSVGLYAAVALHTQQRTREFGIRAALGATPWELMRMVLAQSLTVAVSGIAAGLVMAVVVGKAGSGLLLGVNPVDGFTYVAVAAGLISVMVAACYGPARRAARIDPMQALRDE
jgi:predicted permease